MVAKGKKTPVATSPQLPPAPKNYGTLKSVGVRQAIEKWSEFELDDGTVLKLKPVMLDVQKSNKFNDFGDPIYVTASHMIIKAEVPKRLKKKVKR